MKSKEAVEQCFADMDAATGLQMEKNDIVGSYSVKDIALNIEMKTATDCAQCKALLQSNGVL